MQKDLALLNLCTIFGETHLLNSAPFVIFYEQYFELKPQFCKHFSTYNYTYLTRMMTMMMMSAIRADVPSVRQICNRPICNP